MRKNFILFVSIMLLFSMLFCGCSNSSSEERNSTPIDDKFIVTSNFIFDYAQVIKFSDGDLVQVVGTDPFSKKSTKYYGIYELDGNKLKISVNSTEIVCVYLGDKNCIVINGQEKKILEEKDNIADEQTMSLFD